ncbi:helix-turn-helix domain-containing protein [uncultured Lactobacillus sp.]|uniref:helix-turn-helix domain-containing protein n=1 Tax=uncultured Lactobacillus sp. TaxID=153152 RepID=UPI002605E9BA|nr:helix-turn-helix domain-containing protein [uncultured Lactobacillus sp.]
MHVVIPEEYVIKAIQQQYFSKTDAANFCGVSYTTFAKWVKETPIKTSVVNGQLLYAKEDLIKFMEDHAK